MKHKGTTIKEEQWGRGGLQRKATVEELLKNHKALTSAIHQQKQLSLGTHNARVGTRRLWSMHPLRHGRLGVLCASCLASGVSRRPFLLPQVPCALVMAHSVPPPSTNLPFRLQRLGYPYQIVSIGWHPCHFPTSIGLDPSPGIPESFIHSLPRPPVYRHAYRSLENSLVVTISRG